MRGTGGKENCRPRGLPQLKTSFCIFFENQRIASSNHSVFAIRFIFRSTRQVCTGAKYLRPEYGVPVRSFAKGADAALPALKGDGAIQKLC